MTSTLCYNRLILATILFGMAFFIAGLTVLILNISIPGTICMIIGIVIILIAGMEWRCRERSIPIFFVNPRPESVAITVQPPPEKYNIK